MKAPKIAFIGAGNMASSIVGGLVESGHSASNICAADPYPESLERLQAIAPITACDGNAEAAAGADVIIMAVKPQVMAEACNSVADAVRANNALVISIAAGITIASIQSRFGQQAAIVRCMPNTPALISCGASGLYASETVNTVQREFAETILGAVGIIRWVPREVDLDAVTALSGSGPAYFFLLMEAMAAAGCELGLDTETANDLALQTALGAARMAAEGGVEITELRRRVTSPAGTTEQAVMHFENNGLRTLVKGAMQAASDRAKEMAKEMG